MNLFQIMACPNDLLVIVKFLKRGVLPIIQIGIPIILIVMGTIDLGKAVLSSDDKEIKASTGRLIKRAIAAVFVFFVATIVSLVMGLFSRTNNEDKVTDDPENTSWATCWDEA